MNTKLLSKIKLQLYIRNANTKAPRLSKKMEPIN